MVQKQKNTQMDKKIIDGEWGIHSSTKSLPEERFDPFHSYFDQDGKQIGHRTIFNPIRLHRPFEFTITRQTEQEEEQMDESDTFCELVQGKLPAIVLTKDQLICKDLFSVEPQSENLKEDVVFSAINLYPPISRVLMDKILIQDNTKSIPRGLSIIHVFTRHYNYPEDIPQRKWEVFFQNYRLTLRNSLIHSNISGTDNLYVSTFFNIGSKAGASISHLHGQTILNLNQEGIGTYRNSYLISSKQNEDKCNKCQLRDDINDRTDISGIQSLKKRVIFENDHWLALLAYAPRRDAQIRLVPRKHSSNLWSLNDDELFSLASILIKCNERLTSFIKKHGNRYQLSIDRNIIFNQHHSAKENHFHMFIDILPVQQTGGAELSDDLKFSVIYPEEIAQIMNSGT
jgi:UDPglucose--hexose-1-phosphate uridylyltransferase